MNILTRKFKEVTASVLPITIIVLILNFTIAPMGTELIQRFLVGAVFVIIGLGIFLFGADIGIEPIGNLMGENITKSKKIWLIIIIGFLLGFLINIAEPSLLVLGAQVNAVTSGVLSQVDLVLVVSVGVGILLSIGLLRVVFNIPLNKLLTGLYAIVFLLVILAEESFLSIAFDSGGATTGSMTVPFILAIGIGVAKLEGGKRSEEDSFGLVSIASVGPMLAVLTMSLFSNIESLTGSLPEGGTEVEGIGAPFINQMVPSLLEVGMSILPLVVLFLSFNAIFFKLHKKEFRKILKGLVYTYIGFVIFLTGANAGFMEAGSILGITIASSSSGWVVVLIGFILGFVVILAEPAVHVLNEQIENVTSGHIKGKAILYSLSIGVAFAVGFSILRILVPEIRFWHFIVPGYLTALILSYFAPTLFVGIAFDSGGVASGPMTATFILAFAQGVAQATEGADVVLDGFGVISMVALTPLIALQILGILYERKANAEEGELS